MSFTQLCRTDRLPTVALVQAMLNQERTRQELSVDGIFGPLTEKAVQQFQKSRGLGNGKIVDRTVWEALTQSAGFNVLDSVDVTEPNSEYYFAGGLRKAGGRPLLVGHMCNGVGQMVHNLISAAHAARGSVVLIRMFGHGKPGMMGISIGDGSIKQAGIAEAEMKDVSFKKDVFKKKGGRKLDAKLERLLDKKFIRPKDESMTVLTSGSVRLARTELRRLRSVLGPNNPYASVELHGCRVAYGSQGRRLVRELANLWGTPVSAGLNVQTAGGAETFRLEGTVFTAFPGGGSLRSWSRGLPKLPKMSIS